MFLKLEFDDYTKKIALREGMNTLEGVRSIIKSMHGWDSDSYRLVVSDPYNNPIFINSEQEFVNFIKNSADSTFVKIRVNHLFTTQFNSQIPASDEVGMPIDPEANQENDNESLDKLKIGNEAEENIIDDRNLNENVGDSQILTREMESLRLDAKKNDSELNKNKTVVLLPQESINLLYISLHDPLQENEEHYDKLKTIKQSNTKFSKKNDQRISENANNQKDTGDNQDKADLTVKKNSKIRKRLRKIKEHISESEIRTQRMLTERFASLESKITELKEQLETEHQNNANESRPDDNKIICNTRHCCVICDGCGESPIIGKRYSCMICYDYDLCERCENKCIHSHPMMRTMSANTTRVIDLNQDLDEGNPTDYQEPVKIESDLDADEKPMMIIEEDNNFEEQTQLKFELLDFMFGDSITTDQKTQLVTDYSDLDIADFCIITQTII